MSYNGEALNDIGPVVVDLETAGLPNAADFLDPIPDAVPDESSIEAAKNLTDPVKVAADLEKRRAARLEQNREAQAKVEAQRLARIERAALDWNVGRIVCLCWWTERDGIQIRTCQTEADEAQAISAFWDDCRHRLIVGFNIKGFDLRFLVQRSRYLNIPHPILDFSKYSRKGIHDLYLDLTFGDGTYDQGAMRRTLKAFAKRFGIPCEDQTDGKDIGALVAAGDWGSVVAHCKSDVELTVALARRLRVIQPAHEEAVP